MWEILKPFQNRAHPSVSNTLFPLVAAGNDATLPTVDVIEQNIKF